MSVFANFSSPPLTWIGRTARRVSALAACLALTCVALAGTGLARAGPAAAASASSAPSLTASAATVAPGGSVTFRYSTPPSDLSTSNWIGIYSAGQTPGNVTATAWQYVPNSSGTATFAAAALDGAGSYDAYYLWNNGYRMLAGPVSLTVAGASPAPAPRFTGSFGAAGPDRLVAPYAVAAGAGGTVWVADRGGNRVEEFSAAGLLMRAFGRSGPGGLEHPEGIAVGPDGTIWVSDTGHDRVVEFSPGGREMAVFGAPGSGRGQLDRPEGLAIGPLGSVFVADHGNNRIEKFGTGGGFLSAIKVPTPAGLAITGSGNLWVSSPSYADGNAVEEFGPDGSLLADDNSTQAGYGALPNPAGLAVGPDGRIYVTQPDHGFVTVLNPDGSFFTEFGVPGDRARAGQDLSFPAGVAVGTDGTVWVADTGHGRIAEYAPARHFAAAAAPVARDGHRFVWALLIMALLLLGALGTALLAWRPWRRARKARPRAPGSGGSGGSGGLPDTADASADTAGPAAAEATETAGPETAETAWLFDHVVPPTPPAGTAGTAGERVRGEQIGLGFRTPATIVSPWTAGGLVCSDVFDHTSLIRLIEARFGVPEPNISAWRRTCGDLTSAFRFGGPRARYPGRDGELALAGTESRLLRAQRQVADNPAPRIPPVNRRLPGR